MIRQTIQPKKYFSHTISALLIRAAQKKGVTCQIIKRPLKDKKIIYLKLNQGGKIKWVCPKRGYFNSKTSCDLTLFKYLTNQILQSFNLPSAEMQKITNLKQLNQLSVSKPWVIKPVAEKGGADVYLNIKQTSQLKKKASELFKKYPSLIIEKHLLGKEYRILALANQILAVSQKNLPCLKSDGFHTIKELIQKNNQHRQSKPNDFKAYLKPIIIDSQLKDCLKKQKLQLSSKPPKNTLITLRQNGNFSTGGEIYDVTEKIHPQNKKIALEAIQLLGLEIGGVDLITKDISQPITKTKGGIIEINAGPGIWTHHFPHQGQDRDVSDKIIDYLFS